MFQKKTESFLENLLSYLASLGLTTFILQEDKQMNFDLRFRIYIFPLQKFRAKFFFAKSLGKLTQLSASKQQTLIEQRIFGAREKISLSNLICTWEIPV